MSDDIPTCARHPEVETRLRCSSCDARICPDCANDAATGYICPGCAAAARGDDGEATTGSGLAGLMGRARAQRPAPSRPPAGAGTGGGDRLPAAVGARGTAVGVAASVAGGLLLGPILIGGAFFLLSAGVIGWLVARAVYWATEERTSPYVRAIALTLAGFTVAIGLVSAGASSAPAGLLFLAYPAAVYGGWIVVRQR